jgi:hypothetical protein
VLEVRKADVMTQGPLPFFELVKTYGSGYTTVHALTDVTRAVRGRGQQVRQHMTNEPLRRPRHLGTQLGHVLADLPVILTSPLFRRWHLRWGATSSELTASMAGDDLLARARYRSTRAIEINAAPDVVWPWLVQVGCLRAGWYSNDLLDNLGRPSASTILPELQHLVVGQWVPMAPSPPTGRTALKVHSFAVDECLLWTKPDSTWSWQLTPTASGGTRLVTRIRATYDWRHPATAVLGVVLMEFGDFAMLRRMLRGIKARAEALELARTAPRGQASGVSHAAVGSS